MDGGIGSLGLLVLKAGDATSIMVATAAETLEIMMLLLQWLVLSFNTMLVSFCLFIYMCDPYLFSH